MPTHHRGPAREVRALDAYIKLLRAADTVGARLNKGLSDRGLTPGQLGVLEALFHLGALGPQELGRKLLRSNANVTTVVDNLERAGLARRTRRGDDRRCVTVTLTPAGRRTITRVFPEHAAQIADLFSALSPAEQDELGALCKRLGTGGKS